MVNNINCMHVNYCGNKQTINKKRNSVPFKSNNALQVNKLSDSINTFGIKVPLTYCKTGEKDLPFGLKAHFYKLSNGQRVVIVPKEGKTVVKSYVNTGSMNEPDNLRGISHYIEHNLFNGSDGLSAGEFFKATDNMGAETNASTGTAETNYYISSHLLNEGDLEKEIKLHSSMIETPKFALDMLEKEKGIVNSEINIATAEPMHIAYGRTLKNLFNIKSTSEDLIAGSTHNITNLTRDDVVNYFNNNYYPANIVTVVTGEVEPEETVRLLAKNFSSRKLPPSSRHYEELKPIEKTVREDIISDKTNSAFINMGFSGPAYNNVKDHIKLEALAELMFYSSSASKIFDSLNTTPELIIEKILAKPGAPSAMMIVSDSAENNCEILLRKIYGRIQKYQQQQVSDSELNIVKQNMKRAFANMMESSAAVNSFVGESVLDGAVDSLEDYEKIIDAMTPKDLQETAKKYFDLNKTAITVLHPKQTDIDTISKNFMNSKDVSFTGAVKKKAYNIDNIKQYKLQNNYNLVTYNSNFPDVYANIIVKSDKPIVPKNPATFSVLNEILKYGTSYKTKEEMSRLKENEGIALSVVATRDGLVGSFDCEVKNCDKAFALYRELQENPRFTEESFNKAVLYVKDILSRSEKSPLNKLNPELDEFSHTNEKIIEGLKTLTLDDVKQLYSQLLTHNRAIASYAAPFTKNPELKNNIIALTSLLKPVNPYKPILIDDYKPIIKTKVLTDVDDKNQANIMLAYKFKSSENLKDVAALNLMNIIFGNGPTSRLFNDLREKQKLAYHVKSKISSENTTGKILMKIGTTTDNKSTGEQSFDNLQKSINGFMDNINRIKSEKVSQDELEKAKLAMKNDILSMNEKTIGKNVSILESASGWYGVDEMNKLLEIIDTITVEDIYNTANHVFGGNPIYSITATKDTLDYNEDYLRNLAK